MTTRFTIPTAADVAAYAAEIGYKTFKPDAFLDYWEMRAWMVRPGIKMSSWKAAVRTWQRNDWTAQKPSNNPGAARHQRHQAEERYLREYVEQVEALRSWKGRACPYGDPEDNFRRLMDKIRDNHGPAFLQKLKERIKR